MGNWQWRILAQNLGSAARLKTKINASKYLLVSVGFNNYHYISQALACFTFCTTEK